MEVKFQDKTLSFPDGTPKEDIQEVIRQRFPPSPKEEPKEKYKEEEEEEETIKDQIGVSIYQDGFDDADEVQEVMDEASPWEWDIDPAYRERMKGIEDEMKFYLDAPVEDPGFMDPTGWVGGFGGAATKIGWKALYGVIPNIVGDIAASRVETLEDVPTGVPLATTVAVDMLTGSFGNALKGVVRKMNYGHSFKSLQSFTDEIAQSAMKDKGFENIDDARAWARESTDVILEREGISYGELNARLRKAGPKQAAEDLAEEVRPDVIKKRKEFEAKWKKDAQENRKKLEEQQKAEAIENKKEDILSDTQRTPEEFDEYMDDIANQIATGKGSVEDSLTIDDLGRKRWEQSVGNLYRMNSADDVLKLHQKVARQNRETYNKAAGGVAGFENQGITDSKAWEVIESFKKETGLDIDPNDMLKGAKDFSGKLQDLASELTAWRHISNAMAEDLHMLGSKVTADTATDLEKLQFAEMANLFSEFKPLVEGAKTQIARATASGRIEADSAGINFRRWTEEDLLKDINKKIHVKKALDDLGDDYVVRLAKRYVKNNKDIKANIKLAQENKSVLDAIVEYSRASMLTSPLTILTNVLGNSLRPFNENLHDYLAVIGGKIANKEERMLLPEATARSKALGSALVDELIRKPVGGITGYFKGKTFVDVLSDIANLKPSKIEKAIESSGIVRQTKERGIAAANSKHLEETWLGKSINKVLRNTNPDDPNRIAKVLWGIFDEANSSQRLASYGLLKLTDNPFTRIGYEMELRGNVVRHLYQKGIKDPDAIEGLYSQVKRYRDLINDAQQKGNKNLNVSKQMNIKNKEEVKLIVELDSKAYESAKAAAWMDDSPTFKGMERWLNEHDNIASRILRLSVLPFTKTPINLTSYAVKNSPLAPISKRWRQAFKGDMGDVEQVKAYSQVIVGSLGALMIYQMYDNGILTPSYTQKEKETMYAADIPEHSIKIGDNKYIDGNRLDPFAINVFSIVDAIASIEKLEDNDDEAKWEQLLAVSLAVGTNVYDKTWMRSLGDLFNLATSWGSEEYKREALTRFFTGQASKFIPFSSGIRFASKVDDETYMETSDSWERLKQNMFLGDDIPARDIFGKPRVRETLMGLTTATPKIDSPARKALVDLGVYLRPMKGEIEGQELPTKEKQKLRACLAHPSVDFEGRLNKVVTSPGFNNKSLSDETRREIIKKVYREAKKDAKALYKSTNINVTVKATKQKQQQKLDVLLTPGEFDINTTNVRDLMFRRDRGKNVDNKLELQEDKE